MATIMYLLVPIQMSMEKDIIMSLPLANPLFALLPVRSLWETPPPALIELMPAGAIFLTDALRKI